MEEGARGFGGYRAGTKQGRGTQVVDNGGRRGVSEAGGYGMMGVKIEGIEAGDTEWGTEAGEERRSWDTKGWGGGTEARTRGRQDEG